MSLNPKDLENIVGRLKEALLPEVQGMFHSVNPKPSLNREVHTDDRLTSSRKDDGIDYSARPSVHSVEDDDDSFEDNFELDPLNCLGDKAWDPPPPTENALNKYLRKNLSKEERTTLIDRFPLPSSKVVRPPQIDQSIQQILNQKRINSRQITGLLGIEAVQIRMLETCGPLSAIHAAAHKAKDNEELMHPDAIIEALNHSLLLLGNANAQACYQRQRLVLSKINPGAVSLLSKDPPEEPSSDLFGLQIHKTIKEASEARRNLCANTERTSYRYPSSNRPFRSRPFHQRRSFGTFRHDTSSPYQRNFSPRGKPYRQNSSAGNNSNKECLLTNASLVGQLYRNSNILSTSNSDVFTSNSGTSAQLNQPTVSIKGLGQSHASGSKRHRRNNLVDEEPQHSRAISYSHRITKSGNRVRCIHGRLGCCMQWSSHRWPLVKPRPSSTPPYQPVGIGSGVSCSSSILETGTSCSSAKDGQQDSSSLCEQNRRNPVAWDEQNSASCMEVECGKECLVESRVPPRDKEHYCRLGIETLPGLLELETGQLSIPEATQTISVSSGLVCRQDKLPVENLLELESRPISQRSKRVQHAVEPPERVRIPSILHDNTCDPEVHRGQSYNDDHCSSVEEPGMVPSTPTPCGGTSNTASTESVSPQRSSRGTTSADNVPPLTFGGMESVGGQTPSNCISTEAEAIINSSIRSKSKKSYKSAWSAYHRWCSEQSVNPVQTSVVNVVNYLAHLHSRGLAYNTINLHRSALSFYLPHLEGHSVGSHPVVMRCLRGIFNNNPPLPRYFSTWDPAILVKQISSLPDSSSLSLELLSKKLVCLLALTKACRASDICSLDLQGMVTVQSGVIFKHIHLKKTSRPGFLPNSFFPSFPGNPNICVVATIEHYVKKTAKLRSSSRLVVTTRKPYKPASPSTVARWITSMMAKAGIDVSTFKAHSVRSATTSKAFSKGISLTEIQNCADWSSDNTFIRFYYKHCDSYQFASSVLSQE